MDRTMIAYITEIRSMVGETGHTATQVGGQPLP